MAELNEPLPPMLDIPQEIRASPLIFAGGLATVSHPSSCSSTSCLPASTSSTSSSTLGVRLIHFTLLHTAWPIPHPAPTDVLSPEGSKCTFYFSSKYLTWVWYEASLQTRLTMFFLLQVLRWTARDQPARVFSVSQLLKVKLSPPVPDLHFILQSYCTKTLAHFSMILSN